MDNSDLYKTVNIVDHNTARARHSMNQAAGLIAKMDDDLRKEEEMLQERASRLRRESADTFKLMNDVSKIRQ